jgi:predicted dithiol-disulfide oxidoreductase (DUF899 family)
MERDPEALRWSRGLDLNQRPLGYGILDLVPKGRDEASLEWSMAWVKRHDEYPS